MKYLVDTYVGPFIGDFVLPALILGLCLLFVFGLVAIACDFIADRIRKP